uniref:P2X purinoreceptor 7 intracellular domain-containing protein n=1 Tax=Cyprinus carpio TaxID=7962 RepID=A0A8C2FFT3_CYPCA
RIPGPYFIFCVLYLQTLFQEMTLEEHRELSTLLLEKQPGLVFDALMMHQHRHGAPPFAGIPGVPWCTCGNCREMPTDQERKCCGQEPVNCVSLLLHFSQYCLEEGLIRIHRETGNDNREYRYGAYRHFIYWQHGSLGHYTGFIPDICEHLLATSY